MRSESTKTNAKWSAASVPAKLCIALSGALALFVGGCDRSSPMSVVRSAALSGTCADPRAVVLLDATFVRSTGVPQSESRTFSTSGSLASPTLCIETTHVSSGVVSMNGVQILGPSSFRNGNETFTAPFELLAANSVAVEIRGKPCKPGSAPACSTIRVRAVALPTGPPPPPLVVRVLEPLDACCSDPTCDKTAFAASGGVCPGDPRIRGPLPADASSAASP